MVAQSSKLLWPSVDSIPDLSDHQRTTLATALSDRLGILGGTPGCGKTYVAAALIKSIVAEHGAHSVAVCTPTGKSAVRLNDNLDKYGVGVSAATVHRTLGVAKLGYDGKGWGFTHNANNRLPHRFIVCDEMSMTDTDLGASLLSAIQPGTHVLWIGDTGQLTPVGHGCPMRDMIAAGVPYGELSEIRRNSGAIVHACREIRAGRPWRSCDRINEAAGMNLQHIEQQQPAHALAALDRIIGNTPAEFDRVWGLQVLCAVNAKSEVSRTALNERLQAMLNPGGASKMTANGKFRLGDKVICTTNSLMELVPGADAIEPESASDKANGSVDEWRDLSRGNSHRTGGTAKARAFIANGDIGRVMHVEAKEMHVRFDFPQRTVKVFVGAGNKKTNSNSAGRGRDDSAAQTGCDMDLAYAITTHKAQGSSAPIVITMIDGSFGAGMICSREWYYTALSRAERIAFTIGQRQVIDGHCRRVALGVRKTFLVEKLKELVS